MKSLDNWYYNISRNIIQQYISKEIPRVIVQYQDRGSREETSQIYILDLLNNYNLKFSKHNCFDILDYEWVYGFIPSEYSKYVKQYKGNYCENTLIEFILKQL
jgi:hypothetical protein